VPATCPYNIPIVTLPPHQVNGFSWGPPIRPLNDACLGGIAVSPANEHAWYVSGASGLYMTKDGGQTWTHPITGSTGPLLLVPGRPQLVYVAVGEALYLSRDEGKDWTLLHTFAEPVMSLLVVGQHLYVGLAWSSHAQPSGVFVANLGAGNPVFHAFGPGHTGLIVWTLAHDPLSGELYAGTEIFDHPKPYHPPFFRSSDGGSTWANVAGTLPWHVDRAAVRPTDGYVYALTEGSGLFGSADKGTTWQAPIPGLCPSVSLLVHPKKPKHVFGGAQRVGLLDGGLFLSQNAGKSFTSIGLEGVTVSGLAVNETGTRLFAVAYASGVYSSPIPASA
jgi:photosystem II stability/assembly factor-like uncharacterized protein